VEETINASVHMPSMKRRMARTRTSANWSVCCAAPLCFSTAFEVDLLIYMPILDDQAREGP
jgi:hypothetical protein